MTGPPTVDIHVDNRLTRTSCPLSPCLSVLFSKISTSSDKHLRHGTAYSGSSAFWKAFKKQVATAGYKNKQCRKQTSVLSGRIVTAYVPLRSATERERAAFLIPCQGLRDYFTNFQFTQSQSVSGIHSPFLFYSSVPDAPGRSDSGEYPDSAYAKHLREVSVLRLPNW